MRTRKLLERLENIPTGATFEDIKTLLLREGFQLDRITGSHHIFKTVRHHLCYSSSRDRVKSVYVKRVIELVEQARGQN